MATLVGSLLGLRPRLRRLQPFADGGGQLVVFVAVDQQQIKFLLSLQKVLLKTFGHQFFPNIFSFTKQIDLHLQEVLFKMYLPTDGANLVSKGKKKTHSLSIIRRLLCYCPTTAALTFPSLLFLA